MEMAARWQAESQRARQLDLPIIIGPAGDVMYIEPEGTQLMMVKYQTEGRAGRVEGEARAHGRSSWAVCSRKRGWTKKGGRCETTIPAPMWVPLKRRKSSDGAFTWKLGSGAGAGPRRRW